MASRRLRQAAGRRWREALRTWLMSDDLPAAEDRLGDRRQRRRPTAGSSFRVEPGPAVREGRARVRRRLRHRAGGAGHDRSTSRSSSGSCSPIRSSSPSCWSAITASRATSRRRSTSRATSSQGTVARVVLAGSRGAAVHRRQRDGGGERVGRHRHHPRRAAGRRRRSVPADGGRERAASGSGLYWQPRLQRRALDYQLTLDRSAGSVDVAFTRRGRAGRASSPRSTCRATTRRASGWCASSSS